MRRFIQLLLVAGCLVGGNLALAKAADSALRTVDGYMQALFTGDTGAMKSHMHKQMRKRRASILSNSGYGRTLKNAYSGARYEVVKSSQRSATSADVLVRITLKSSDQVHVTFKLEESDDGYSIISES